MSASNNDNNNKAAIYKLPSDKVVGGDDKCCFKLPLFRASPQFFNPKN